MKIFIVEKYAKKQKGGFTIIELLVTISIFVFMTILVITNYGAFNQGTLMTNLAYDMALSIRTAQTYGISVKTTNANGDSYNAAYGIDFNTNNPTHTSTQYVMFADTNGDEKYESGEAVNIYNITQGAKITGMCAIVSGSSCAPNQSQNVLDVMFKRPDPEAIICANSSCSTTYGFAEIYITSGVGNSVRTVSVNQDGEISVGD